MGGQTHTLAEFAIFIAYLPIIIAKQDKQEDRKFAFLSYHDPVFT